MITLTDNQLELCITAVNEMVRYWEKEAKERSGVFGELSFEQLGRWTELLELLLEKED